MPRFVAETAMLPEETTKLQGVAKMGEANVAVLDDLQEKGFSFNKTIAELLPVVEMALDVRLDAEKVCSMKMEFTMLKQEGALFNEAVNAVNRELSVSRVECAILLWNRDEILLRLKTLETDLGKFQNIVSGRNTEGS